MLSLVGWVVPVPRLTGSWVVFFTVYRFGFDGGVVPRFAFFIGVLRVVEFCGKVEEVRGFVSYGLEAMPVVAWNLDYLGIFSC